MIILVNFEQGEGSVTVVLMVPRIMFYCVSIMYHGFKMLPSFHGIISLLSGFFRLKYTQNSVKLVVKLLQHVQTTHDNSPRTSALESV